MKFEQVAIFVAERRFFENDDGSRVIIADARTDQGGHLTLRGPAYEGELKSGMRYRFYGTEKDHPRFGSQFVFDNFVIEKPIDAQGVVAYLTQCHGIGPVIATKIWDLYNKDAVVQLRRFPEMVADQVNGLTLENAVAAAKFLNASVSIEKCKIEVMGLLKGRGFPKKVLNLVLADFGTTAAREIKRDPYKLMRYPGVGFLKCDQMYLSLGGSPSKLKRQALCLRHAIASGHGDTWYPERHASQALNEQLSGARANLKKALELSRRSKLLDERWVGNQRWLADAAKSKSEAIVANAIQAFEKLDLHAMWPGSVSELSEHQRDALASVLNSRIGILAGSPGTGKTFVSAALIKAIMSLPNNLRVQVLAPTGKAAVRITEAMRQAGLGIKARTIHSYIFGGTPSDEKPTFVIVDEFSMVDTDIAAELLKTADLDTHFLFVGDVNQLSPVGHGAPLRDLVAAGVPTGTLTEIRRNSGRIVQCCAEIRDHQRFTASPKLDLENGENLVVAECGTPEEQIETLRAIVEKAKLREDFDALWDMQVVVAVNKKSPLGRKSLNLLLQKLCNENKPKRGTPFAVGDKIICLKNGRFSALDKWDSEAIGGQFYVANGEQAEVLEAEPNKTIAKLPTGKVIVIPRASKDEDDQGDDEEGGSGCDWDLGYAISVHKSQGSEWRTVVVMLDDSGSASRVCSRNWLYTAISRGKQSCICIGKRKTAEAMCKRNGLDRKTFLVERINELRAEAMLAGIFDEVFEQEEAMT